MAYRRTASVEARLRRTRDTILRAARQRIAADGLHGVSVADVAATAGVSVGTVYRHVADKTALLREVVDDICRMEIGVVAKVATEPGSDADRLLAAVETFARRAVASGRVAYAVIAEPAPPDVERLRVGLRRDLAEAFASVIADGVAAGEFPAQDPMITATAIVGAVSEVLVGPLSPTDRTAADTDLALAEVVAHIRRAVIGAPGPRGAE
jgi:AcrR family transcriptional regulator